MKLCPTCSQILAQNVTACPACGRQVDAGRTALDDYQLLQFVHEGYGSMLYRAQKAGDGKPVLIRIFKPEARIDEAKAQRLREELLALREIQSPRFVQHHEIRRSADGVWYRVSEWVETIPWSELFASATLGHSVKGFGLLSRIASTISQLHQRQKLIPHLILYDILVFKDVAGELDVKLDYKLSRFLDPRLAHPSPMLACLMSCHPDIAGNRPLDQRSDLWSLGKLFVEILARSEQIADFTAELDRLALPPRVTALLQQMLQDDPDLRLDSAAKASEVFAGVTDDDLCQAKLAREAATGAPRRQVRQLRVAIVLIVLALAVAALLVGGKLQQIQTRRGSDEQLKEYAARYSPQVAFIAVEFWLDTEDGRRVVSAWGEGTAFLVDAQGYLMTNRHVACPWLAEGDLAEAAEKIRKAGHTPHFGYRLFLWFEGQNVLRRSAEGLPREYAADRYLLDNAYRSDAKDNQPSVRIVAVSRPPAHGPAQKLSPLSDDVAILKVSFVPPQLLPLPLADAAANSPAKLTPILALGFPLGHQTITDTQVTASATLGHIRRSFSNVVQADVSLHPGNSGGPVIAPDGKVIGIASAISVSRGEPQSDMGMILPVRKGIELLRDAREGRIRWTGEYDPSLDQTFSELIHVAENAGVKAAAGQALDLARSSTDPDLLRYAGTLQICAGKAAHAESLLARAISVDPDSAGASRLLQYINSPSAPCPGELRSLTWRDSDEFCGYAARVLAGEIAEEQSLECWEDRTERVMLHYVNALRRVRRGDMAGAQSLLEQALQNSLEADNAPREQLLVRSLLGSLQQGKGSPAEADAPLAPMPRPAPGLAAKAAMAQYIAAAKGSDEQLTALRRLRYADAMTRSYAAALACQYAGQGNWKAAEEQALSFLAKPDRPSANWLAMRLLAAQMPALQGRKDVATERLEKFVAECPDSWYRTIAQCVAQRASAEDAERLAAENPANAVTLHTALGLRAEADGDTAEAIRHYHAAMESFMDHWAEYDLARGRIVQLGKK